MNALQQVELREELNKLPLPDLAALAKRTTWVKKQARKEQLAPPGDWTTWVILTGRGWGKTRTGAEETWWQGYRDPGSFSGVIAPTFDMLNAICFGGESGLLACIPSELIEDYNKSTQVIRLINKSEIQGISAQEPDRIRGRQWSRVWCDELASWQYLTESLDNINFCLRLGKYPRRIITTTPKPLKAIRDMLVGKKTHVTTGSTYDNRANLPASFFNDIARYSGTKIGQQEIEGKLIDWSDSGIFKLSWLNIWPNKDKKGKLKRFPKLIFVLQSYDTAFKLKQANDPSAGTTWGVFQPYRDEDAADIPAGHSAGEYAVMLLDAWAERLEYPELRAKLKTEFDSVFTDDNKRVDVVLIEDKASGQALIPDLQRAGIPVEAYTLPPDSDKIQRAHAVSHLAKRYIWIPETTYTKAAGKGKRQWEGPEDAQLTGPTYIRDWAQPFVDQLVSFGPDTFREMERMRRAAQTNDSLDDVTTHDDFVDTFTQALAWLRDSEWLRLPADNAKEPEPEEQPKRVAAYG